MQESSSVSRIFYALDTFCENLEEKLLPYLGELMQRALSSLSDVFSIRIRELGISLIGSAANAVKSEFIPYFDNVLAPLQGYLTMQHTDDTQVSHSNKTASPTCNIIYSTCILFRASSMASTIRVSRQQSNICP